MTRIQRSSNISSWHVKTDMVPSILWIFDAWKQPFCLFVLQFWLWLVSVRVHFKRKWNYYLSFSKTADYHDWAYHFEPSPVDDGEGAVADEVLGGVLVDPHRLHPEAVARGGGTGSVASHGGGWQPNRSRILRHRHSPPSQPCPSPRTCSAHERGDDKILTLRFIFVPFFLLFPSFSCVTLICFWVCYVLWCVLAPFQKWGPFLPPLCFLFNE